VGLLSPGDATYSVIFVAHRTTPVEVRLAAVRLAFRHAASAVRAAFRYHAAGILDQLRTAPQQPGGGGHVDPLSPRSFQTFVETSVVSVPSNPNVFMRHSPDNGMTGIDSPWELEPRDMARYAALPSGARLFVPRWASSSGGAGGRRSQSAAGVAWFDDPCGHRHHRVAALGALDRHKAHTPFGDGGTVAKATPDRLIYPDLFDRLTGLRGGIPGDAAVGLAAAYVDTADPLALGQLADCLDGLNSPDAPAVRRQYDLLAFSLAQAGRSRTPAGRPSPGGPNAPDAR
jgi:hypothetical protein